MDASGHARGLGTERTTLRIPTPLAWIILIVLFLMARRPLRPGALLGTGTILYSTTRFWLDFLRNVDLANADARYFGLTPGQYGSVLTIGLGLFAIRRGRRRPPWPEANASSSASPRPRSTMGTSL